MAELRAKSILLTGYLEYLLNREFGKDSKIRTQDVYLEIATPADPKQRGAQLSLMFSVPMSDIHSQMMKRGIVVRLCSHEYSLVINIHSPEWQNQGNETGQLPISSTKF